MPPVSPTGDDASDAVRRLLGVEASAVERFPTGAQHYVYDVELADGRRVVARLSLPEHRELARGALGWHRLLRPRGVPLPELLASAVEPEDGPFPVMVLERLPGADLQHVYRSLTHEQRATIAGQVAAIQRIVGGLAHGRGYGYATSPDDDDLHPTWGAVLDASLARSRERIAAAGAVDPAHVDRVAALAERYRQALDAVPPRAFLDDTTTKNVIVHEGRLTGIVDVDHVCYGDPLYVVALTRMALLSRGHATGYVDAWLATLDPTPARDPDALLRLDLYTAVFCVDFMGELGQRFNKTEPEPMDPAYATRLAATLDGLIAHR